MPPPHTGFELCKKINEFLHEWGLENKIFPITLDNASSNDVLVKTLKEKLVLQNSLLCDGEFFHVCCCAHILNLIVQEGLKAIGDGVDLIRESIKYVRGSESKMIKFKQCINQVGDIDAKSTLCLDVPTRWNSTFLMLQSALQYQRVFGSLHLVDENYKCCPSPDKWKRPEKICTFLMPFYDITTFTFASSYPTSNLYFLQVWNIQTLLMEKGKDEDDLIRHIAERMMIKFDKYWDEYSEVLAFGAILDPRVKLETLGYCLEQIDPLSWEAKLDTIKEKLYRLFSQYCTNTSSSTEARRSNISTSSASSKCPHLDVSFLSIVQPL